MAGRGISGIALAALGAGALFLFSGVQGKSLTQALQYLIQGKNPGGAPKANPITGSGSAGGGSGGGAAPVTGNAQQALQQAAAQHGWGSGAEWQALQSVEMREAGFSITATNPGSGAYGLAQFIQGPSEYYQYGGNPDTAGGQAVAMCNYIAQRYGDPIAAWAHEQQYGWY